MPQRVDGSLPYPPAVRPSGSSCPARPARFRSRPKSRSATSGSFRCGPVAKRMREAAAPLYLLLCLILGGSAQGIWANMVLQLLGLAMLAWAALAPVDE